MNLKYKTKDKFNKQFKNYTIIILIFSFLFNNILYPSYYSLLVDCFPDKSSEKNITILGSYNSKTNSIFLNPNLSSFDYKRVLKHENRHKLQDKQNRLFNCDNPTGVLLNEMESYFTEWFP